MSDQGLRIERLTAGHDITTFACGHHDLYGRHGFVEAPEHQRRLYRRMKDIRASLDHTA